MTLPLAKTHFSNRIISAPIHCVSILAFMLQLIEVDLKKNL